MTTEQRLSKLELSCGRWKVATAFLGIFITAMFYVSAENLKAEGRTRSLFLNELHVHHLVVDSENSKAKIDMVVEKDDASIMLVSPDRLPDGTLAMGGVCYLSAKQSEASVVAMIPSEKRPVTEEIVNVIFTSAFEGFRALSTRDGNSLVVARDGQAKFKYSSQLLMGRNFMITDKDFTKSLSFP